MINLSQFSKISSHYCFEILLVNFSVVFFSSQVGFIVSSCFILFSLNKILSVFPLIYYMGYNGC